MAVLKNPIISRMLEASGLPNVSRLAALLGIRPQTIQPYKGLETVPDSWLQILQQKTDINIEYIKTGNGPPKIRRGPDGRNLDSIGRKYDTIIFGRNGEDSVMTDHPAAGLVTNASGLELPGGHMIEYILCLDVRPFLDTDGNMILDRHGLALAADRLDRLGVSHDGARSLQTPDGLVIFDASDTSQRIGSAYVVSVQGLLACMRLTMGPAGLAFAPLAGGQHIPLAAGPDGPTPRIVGRAAWIGKEL